MVGPQVQRAVASFLVKAFEFSERRACGLIGIWRTTMRYRSKKQEIPGLRARLLELAAQRPRFGYERLYVLLRREGFQVNHKRILRMYREEGLAVLRKKRGKKLVSGLRVVPDLPLEHGFRF